MPVEYVRQSEVDDDVVREFNQMATTVNAIKASLNSLLTKMDADPTLAATDWAAGRTITAADVDTFYLGY
jgi:hypothetical protein